MLGKNIRILLPLILIVAATSFSAGVAHSDIFVRKDAGEKAGAAESKSGVKSFFLRPFQDRKSTAKRAQNQSRVNYGARTNVSTLRRNLSEDLKLLAAWNKADRKPETAAEVQSFAKAHRAENRMAMLQMRSDKVAMLDAKKKKRLSDYRAEVLALAPDPDAMIAFNIAQAEANRPASNVYKGYSSRASHNASDTAAVPSPKVRQVYRPAPVTDTPSRVYRDY